MSPRRLSSGHPNLFLHLLLGTLAAIALLVASTAVAAAEPAAGTALAPGWESHATSLIPLGPTHGSTRNKWRVPGNTPRGRYVLVDRAADGSATLIPGLRFTVGSDANREIHLLVPAQYTNVQAVLASDVPAGAVPASERARP